MRRADTLHTIKVNNSFFAVLCLHFESRGGYLGTLRYYTRTGADTLTELHEATPDGSNWLELCHKAVTEAELICEREGATLWSY